VNLRHWVYGLPSSQSLARVEGTPVWHVTLRCRRARASSTSSRSSGAGTASGARTPATEYARATRTAPTRWRTVPGTRSSPSGRASTRLRPPAAWTRSGSTVKTFGRREVGLYLPARFRRSRRYPLLIVHDGHDYLNYAALGAILDNLTARLEIAGIVVLTSSPYRCASMPTTSVTPASSPTNSFRASRRRLPSTITPQSRCLAGASFGAVASLSTAWRRPGFYGRLLLQSGSFAFTDIGDRNARGPALRPGRRSS
jgi:enterochelin esterase-like enzyme